jgi:molecular chaperone GrpE
MMKKKMKNHVDVKHNNTDKSTEIKENTTDRDKFSGEASDLTVTDMSEESASDVSEAEATPSDKVDFGAKSGEEKLAEMQDKYIRLSAEFDNYRKRTLREKMDLSKYAGEKILLGILPLMDDFERAIKHIDVTADYVALKDGIEIIYGKFSDFLKQNGIKEIEALNCSFNVDLHDAVANVPVEEAEKKGKVVDVLLKGYFLQDKVLRHSKVVVGE